MAKAPSPHMIKKYVREIYARLAASGTANVSHLPISSGKDLAGTLGYETVRLPIPPEAWDLFAGCGNPLTEIKLEPNWTVVDLGCGVGIDSQIVALSLRPPGMVVGIDFTTELLRQAKAYSKAGAVCHWVAGDGEQLPLRPESIHLVIANGSFNLIPHKEHALAEVYRVLKPGGFLALADLVRTGDLEPIFEGFEDAWSWCVAGALSAGEYDLMLKSQGFCWWELQEKFDHGPLASAHLLARKQKKE